MEEDNSSQESFISRLQGAIENAVATIGFALVSVNGVAVARLLKDSGKTEAVQIILEKKPEVVEAVILPFPKKDK